MNKQQESHGPRIPTLQDVHLFDRLHLKLNVLPNDNEWIEGDVLPDHLLHDFFSTETRSDLISNENVPDLKNRKEACFLYYYGQFESIGLIFIGYKDGSIEMVSLLKTMEKQEDISCQKPRRFSFLDSSNKKQRCHQAPITGILCFSVVSGSHLLMTSCSDGFVKFWFLDTETVNNEIQPCIKLVEIGFECNLGSGVVCLKFLFNQAYYSKIQEKDTASLWRVFHVVAVCRNGDIYRWDPALIPKVIMTEVSRYEVENIFKLIIKGIESLELINDIKNNCVEINQATVSQKLTATEKAYLVCGLSNGYVISVQLSFIEPNDDNNRTEVDYIMTNVASYYEPSFKINPIRKVVESQPFEPDNSFRILSKNKIFVFNPKEKIIYDEHWTDNNAELVTICDNNYSMSAKSLYNFYRTTSIPLGYLSRPFSPFDLCWIFRSQLLCVASEKGTILLYNLGTKEWFEICCSEYTLLKYNSFTIINHYRLSDVSIVAHN